MASVAVATTKGGRLNLALMFAGMVGMWAFSMFLMQVFLVPDTTTITTSNSAEKTHEEPPKMTSRHGKSTTSTATKQQEANNDKDPYHDKTKLMDMLRSMSVDPESIDNATWAQVPTWTEIQTIWGRQPIIWGLHNCAAFRQAIPNAKRRRIAIGGLFSTGTNLMAQLLQHNCAIPERVQWLGRQRGHGIEWQVPWGKHNPFRYHLTHKVQQFTTDRHDPKLEEYLPAVTLRDPFSWMTSMCRNPYTARWRYSHTHQCPNFNGNDQDTVRVKFGAEPNQRVPFSNLVDLWNTWNGEHFNETKVPLVMIRFEDIVFYPRELTQQVCECAGGELTKPLHIYSDKDTLAKDGDFHYAVGTAVNGPGHGAGAVSQRNGLVDAWIKYGKPYHKRIERFSDKDVQFANQLLDKRITDFFGYTSSTTTRN